jgi:DNA topoisomerase I
VDAPVVGDRVLGINPENGKQVVAKDGRFGPYVTELDPEPEVTPEEAAALAAAAAAAAAPVVDPATGEVIEPPKKRAPAKKKAPVEKPRTASLFKDMDPNTVDFETALKLLNLPRVVGDDPESGEPITAQNGRYGPYLKKGTDTRSLDAEAQIFEIDLDGALAKFAEPKYGARKASSALKEFDADPVSGKPIKLKDGRFGPYVTDGETNATVPRGEDPMEIDFDRAVQLIADKRAKGPAKKPVKRAAGAGAKTATKKAPAKKAATPKAAAPKKAS